MRLEINYKRKKKPKTAVTGSKSVIARGMRKLFGVMEMFYKMIVAVFYVAVYICQTHRLVPLKLVKFIVCKFYVKF